MSVKKFVAPDMRQALKLVRDQMGADAVILSNKKVADGVEITAALDYDDVVEKHKQKQRRDARIPDFADEKTAASAPIVNAERIIKTITERRDHDAQRAARIPGKAPHTASRNDHDLNDALVTRSDHLANLKGAHLAAVRASAERRQAEKAPEPLWDAEEESSISEPVESAERKHETQLRRQFKDRFDSQDVRLAFDNEAVVTQARELSEMRSELNKLRALLDTRFAHVAWSDYSHRHPVEASSYRQLHRMGISASICRRLVDQLPVSHVKDGLRLVMQRLHKEFSIYEPDIRETGGVIALLGPAGVGKTTSISKLAAAYALRHGVDDVALVTTDSYRIAGHEQLKTLSKILRVPMRVVTEQHPLEQVLDQLSNKKLVLVDTAGLSNRDQDFDEQMKILEKLPSSVTRWLVLASTSQKRILEKAVEDYQTLRLDGCILTKLDECASLGEALSVVVEARLPVAYTTDGQNIPDDIERPRVVDLLGHAMELASRSELEDEDTAEWFSDEMVAQHAYDGAA